ncbi:Phosphatidylinositol 4,5-bisphosphate-binding protein SLM1 [Trichophyton interdigitale]|uniref:Phosphatidylinositol 4,5-bisphosphate-binding protein SLM1 n=1 Tax=Trichophyton interdigitale TaxID=101480 RepID=A0A9P4YII5_9EURO|nr:Phosphatidylinositol 4,5-bisphosphate-binding protein SLM1 [Trichophyton interdigitale]KAF3899984.1 Phosphatidylinositol 4,5-bisphosphate-binding protein SLM1 [Trichophyton interdigitale]KAG8209929.1 Phosphatidylinositol 4,5-bisphosphate-binding protein SLM1 [Trichophyton interdigitale]
MANRSGSAPHDTASYTMASVDHTQLNTEYNSMAGSRPASYIANSSIGPSDFHVRSNIPDASPLSQQQQQQQQASAPHQSRFQEVLSVSRRGSMMDSGSVREGPRTDSPASTANTNPISLPSRSSTLKKKPSLSKKASLRRGGSRKSSRAGSVRSMNLGEKEKYGVAQDEANSAFFVPIPTSGNPTEVLAARFQAWRKVLKDLVAFFRDVQRSCETRAKSLISASSAINNIAMPPMFLISGGISDATEILKDYHKQALHESNKAREMETEIIMQLNGLRADLGQKIKEIKNLSGDFKNTVDKEVEVTRKAVKHLHEALGLVDSDAAATSGKGDPFLLRMSVDRQLERQIEEENYLHRAYLNLERSGRELESIVVGEIQKSYNVYASILKRDADSAYHAVERLKEGPISIPKDHEWRYFIDQTDQMVDPDLDLRDLANITYPGKDHPAAAEVRAGMLERKSKYLRSYTPGWYVLSPTHLHEFKSADRIASQHPVMSLYLPEQKLGSHSTPESSSHKFMLKGRQTGSMHRGHAWVFRAESHETMLAWYDDIKALTEKTGAARDAFVRRHARSYSGASYRTASISSDGVMDEDEADKTPYSADHLMQRQHSPTSEATTATGSQWRRQRSVGRFPSDVQINQHLNAPLSPSSSENRDVSNTVPISNAVNHNHNSTNNEQRHSQHFNQGINDLPSRASMDSESRSSRPIFDRRHSQVRYEDWAQPHHHPRPITISSQGGDSSRLIQQTPSPLSESPLRYSQGPPLGDLTDHDHHQPAPTSHPHTTNHQIKPDGVNGTAHHHHLDSDGRDIEHIVTDGVTNNRSSLYPTSPLDQPLSRTSIDLKVPGQFPQRS